MSERMEADSTFWRIVKEYGIQVSEVEKMTLSEMQEACAYLDMRTDYKNAWSAYFEIKSEQSKGK